MTNLLGNFLQRRVLQPFSKISAMYFAIAATIATWLLIIQGAFVRATGSGAGCGKHWPTCNGDIVPLNHSTESLIEFSHRLLSLVILVFGGLLLARAFQERKNNKPLFYTALAAFILLLNEAFLGALTVLWGLTGENASTARGLMVASHLINSLLLMSALSMALFFAYRPHAKVSFRKNWGLFAALAFGICSMLLLMFSGGIASMGNTMFPASSLAAGIAQDFDLQANILLRLRILHPILGMTIGTYLLLLLLLVWWLKPSVEIKRLGQALAIVYVAQIGLGFLNLFARAPIALQLSHLATATVIFSLLSILCVAALSIEKPILRKPKKAKGNVKANVKETAPFPLSARINQK